jgi:hypothetical protein
MSMFISRPSEPRTVLLWGDRWWFAGNGMSGAFNDLPHAIEVLVAHYADEPKPVRLRLIYQPDGLETVAVACPQGDRATLAAALAGEFPAMDNPACVWSHEPVLPMGGDYSTLLHLETQPGLLTLATQLAHRGLAVDSAWPLVTFLQTLPSEWSDSGAVTVLAVQEHRAIAYRHPSDGVRSALQWSGVSAVAEVGEWLGEILRRNAEEPVLLVCADEATSAVFGTFTGVERYPGVELVSLHEALARPVVLPRYHPAQLLPRPPLLTAQRAMLAASIAFLLAAGWSGGTYARDRFAARQTDESHQVELATLRAEVAHLRENAAEIAALRRSLDGGAAGPPCGAWLDQIAATLPSQITLTSLRITGRSVALTGWIAPGAARTTLEDWRTRVASAGESWTFENKPGPAGSFSLTGGFRL